MKHTLSGDYTTREVYLDGKYLDPKPSQRHHNHSPDGFNWSYGGSGPAQLALAIFLKLVPDLAAWNGFGYQDFKFRFIAALPASNFEVEFNFPEDGDLEKFSWDLLTNE